MLESASSNVNSGPLSNNNINDLSGSGVSGGASPKSMGRRHTVAYITQHQSQAQQAQASSPPALLAPAPASTPNLNNVSGNTREFAQTAPMQYGGTVGLNMSNLSVGGSPQSFSGGDYSQYQQYQQYQQFQQMQQQQMQMQQMQQQQMGMMQQQQQPMGQIPTQPLHYGSNSPSRGTSPVPFYSPQQPPLQAPLQPLQPPQFSQSAIPQVNQFDLEFQQQQEFLRQHKEKLRRRQEMLQQQEEELRAHEAQQIQQEQLLRQQQEQYRLQQEAERQAKLQAQQAILAEQRDTEQQRMMIEQHQQRLLEEQKKVQQRQLQHQQQQILFQKEQQRMAIEHSKQEAQYRSAMLEFQKQQDELEKYSPPPPTLNLTSPTAPRSPMNMANFVYEESIGNGGIGISPTSYKVDINNMANPTVPVSPTTPSWAAPTMSLQQYEAETSRYEEELDGGGGDKSSPLKEAQMRWSSAVSQWKVLSSTQEKTTNELMGVVQAKADAQEAERLKKVAAREERKAMEEDLVGSVMQAAAKIEAVAIPTPEDDAKPIPTSIIIGGGKRDDKDKGKEKEKEKASRRHTVASIPQSEGGEKEVSPLKDEAPPAKKEEKEGEWEEEDDDDEKSEESEESKGHKQKAPFDPEAYENKQQTMKKQPTLDELQAAADHLDTDDESMFTEKTEISSIAGGSNPSRAASRQSSRQSSRAGSKKNEKSSSVHAREVDEAEVARLQKLIDHQNRAQSILEEQMTSLQKKLEDFDNVDRRRRGSEMALASLSEQQKLMESSEASIKAQLLEAKAASTLVKNEISSNLEQQETIANLMSSHKTFTSAYEMRVAELEAENGELHGFMSALMNDPTEGMLKAVMGFYRQRYFEGDEFRGATVLQHTLEEESKMSAAGSEFSGVGSVQQPLDLLDASGGGQEEEEEEYEEEDDQYEEPPPPTVQSDAPRASPRGRRGYQNRRHTVGGGIPLRINGNQSRGNSASKSKSPGRSGTRTPPERSQSPPNGNTPRYMGDTAKSATRNHVRRMSASSKDIRRDSWMNGGAVSGDGSVLLHSTTDQPAHTRHLHDTGSSPTDYDSLAMRTRSYTGDNRAHHHVPGVRLGTHTATVTAQDRARMKEQREEANRRGRSAGPPRSVKRPTSPGSPKRMMRSASPKRSQGGSFQYKTAPGKMSPASSPVKWFMALDASSGLNYWYNPWTQATTWTKPDGFDSSRAVYTPPQVYRGGMQSGYSSGTNNSTDNEG
ncbi:hypothetical protein TL16_g11459 [Triparma laevis f. inornata]|uniref:WW domain-containing protein n=1 Tax=Triparma laevis f. inornata TaxID=1714386 RepID=A0A9W7BK90_9STRA|nr:hypothetical protein TL16_g11459 [Triparma laevis f. inornata]